jgi:hypothetical protein
MIVQTHEDVIYGAVQFLVREYTFLTSFYGMKDSVYGMSMSIYGLETLVRVHVFNTSLKLCFNYTKDYYSGDIKVNGLYGFPSAAVSFKGNRYMAYAFCASQQEFIEGTTTSYLRVRVTQ